MKYIFTIISSVIITVSLVAIGFTIKQVDQQRNTLIASLEQRALLLSENLKNSVKPLYASSSQPYFQTSLKKTADKFINSEHLDGIALYDSKGVLLASSKGLSSIITGDTQDISNAMDSNNSSDNFINIGKNTEYIYILTPCVVKMEAL